ncbi:MAG: DUF5615 family PIN-like protein [Planctomycetota bacterium]
MTRPRFLADEDLRHGIVLAAQRLEPRLEIITVQETALRASSDGEVLDFAANQGWLVLSHDVSTMRAAADRRVADGLPMLGLFLIPQSRSTTAAADSLQLIWSASEFEEWHDRIVYLPL